MGWRNRGGGKEPTATKVKFLRRSARQISKKFARYGSSPGGCADRRLRICVDNQRVGGIYVILEETEDGHRGYLSWAEEPHDGSSKQSLRSKAPRTGTNPKEKKECAKHLGGKKRPYLEHLIKIFQGIRTDLRRRAKIGRSRWRKREDRGY